MVSIIKKASIQMLIVKLETVTPLFLAGADPRGAPELRAASVRGALRYWLRALLGGVIGDQNWDALRKAEAAVWGSTKTGASPVVVRMYGKLRSDYYQPLLHNPKKKFTFRGISPGQTLCLELSPRPPYREVSSFVLSVTVLWLLLGGLGKRSRRGFGTLQFPEGIPRQPFTHDAYKNMSKFEQTLQQVIEKAQNEAQSHISTLQIAAGTPNNLPAFPLLHSNHTKILFCRNKFSTWETAMMDFWRLLRGDQYRDDPVFGFAGQAGRQASPLHLRIIKIDKSYHLLLTAFRSRFQSRDPDWRKLQDFLRDCAHRWQGTWIMGKNIKW